jgi:hypothetical protein
MDTSPETIVAAEALRTWVHEQRKAWADGNPLPSPPPAVASRPAPVPIAVASPVSVAPRPEPAAVHAKDQPRHDATPMFGMSQAAPVRRTRRVQALMAVAGVVLAAALGTVLMNRRATVPPTGTASIDSEPRGAQVLIDGAPAGSTPVTVELAVGRHAVELRRGDATRTEQVVVARGRESTVRIDWVPRRYGGLQVTSTPDGARVLIDGQERGVTPLTLSDVLVGAHTVIIDSPDGKVRRKVVIAEGLTETLTESIYPGWVHVTAPMDVTVMEGTTAVVLDDHNRGLLKSGTHDLLIENRALGVSERRQVEIEPGGTTDVTLAPRTSTLSVTTSAPAEVLVDGVRAGDSPLASFQVSLGTHDIIAIDRSGVTRHATVTVTAKPAQVEINFSRP